MSRIRQYFFTGIAVLLPAMITIILFNYIWKLADASLVSPLYSVLPIKLEEEVGIIVAKVVLLLLVFMFVCMVGFAANLFIFKRLIRFGEKVLDRVPMVNRVYSTLKDISAVFFSNDKKNDMFRSAVLIEYPRKGVYSVAFVTNNHHPLISNETQEDVASVFLPTTPNPTSDFLLFLPKSDITPIHLGVEEAIKLVISAGSLSTRNQIKKLAENHKKDK